METENKPTNGSRGFPFGGERREKGRRACAVMGENPGFPPKDEQGQLAVDVYQTPTQIIIIAPIAGVKLNDIQVSITEDVLTIKGKRCLEFNIPDEDYLTQECFWGTFSRSIVLPASADSSSIAATLKDSVLKIILKRTEREKTRIVRIKTD